MTPELTFLTLTTILAASLWIPFIVGVNSTPVTFPNENRPPDISTMVPWVHRAYRAHLNLMEQFPPFAAAVLIAHMAGVSTPVTIWASALFFGLRVVHAVWMIGDFRQLPVRPILFTAAWLCIIAIAVQLLLA